ncbi:methyltransferase, FkbM family [Rivularia sp. PCC 7116]|uniref:FkbM family methyltransferase n=1 Tax=Rivularia sp. PCC 7116 TaxID=373994 RepID=UPI00029F081E|nr:FkbM family methyltransferase [Rivularia sp. PCC 7116]AFY58298.1 methyltransferase, FkbM family [Rivularia sp. PCC 7116]
MSIYNTLRSYWWDNALMARHMKLQAKRVWWNFLTAWEKTTPGLYNKIQTGYRQQRPSAEQTVSSEAYGTVVTVNGVRMKIDPRMTPFQVKKLIDGRHTREERRLLIHRLEPDDIVMELGGGIGMLAIACALKIGGERVYSYEANPVLESLIRENYALNDVKPEINMCMLDETHDTCTFHVSEHFSRSSAFKPADDKTVPYEVAVKPLNDEIARIKPTVLIMDVQGSEGKLLSFANLSTVSKLLVEVHPDMLGLSNANALRRNLRTQGFEEVERSGQSFLYIRK